LLDRSKYAYATLIRSDYQYSRLYPWGLKIPVQKRTRDAHQEPASPAPEPDPAPTPAPVPESEPVSAVIDAGPAAIKPQVPAALLSEVAKVANGVFERVYVTPTPAGGYRISAVANGKTLFIHNVGDEYSVPEPVEISGFDRAGAYSSESYDPAFRLHVGNVADPLPDLVEVSPDVLKSVKTTDGTVEIENIYLSAKNLVAVRRKRPVQIRICPKGVLWARTESGINLYIRARVATAFAQLRIDSVER